MKNALETNPKVVINPKDPISIRARRPNRSIMAIPTIVKIKLITPIPAVDNKAEPALKPVISKMRGA